MALTQISFAIWRRARIEKTRNDSKWRGKPRSNRCGMKTERN
jgi:hypothetical protein